MTSSSGKSSSGPLTSSGTGTASCALAAGMPGESMRRSISRTSRDNFATSNTNLFRIAVNTINTTGIYNPNKIINWYIYLCGKKNEEQLSRIFYIYVTETTSVCDNKLTQLIQSRKFTPGLLKFTPNNNQLHITPATQQNKKVITQTTKN